ncbi:MAG: putative capsid protein [Circoviridae sp.]|nr:MAG: putative capsid protein [Circoviridae sp.]
MPRGKKKNYRKKRKSKRKLRVPRPPINGFPARQLAVHRYSNVATINAGSAGEVGSKLYMISSAHAPEVGAAVNFQPRGYDELSLVYNRYCVVGAKITVRPVGPQRPSNASATVANAGLEYGIAMLRTPVFSYTNYHDLVERWGQRQRATIPIDIGESKTLTRKYSLKKWFSHKNPLTDDVVTSATGSSPSKNAFMAVWLTSPSGGAFPEVKLHVQIDFSIVWYERHGMDAS